jgi:hypothetical protein
MLCGVDFSRLAPGEVIDDAGSALALVQKRAQEAARQAALSPDARANNAHCPTVADLLLVQLRRGSPPPDAPLPLPTRRSLAPSSTPTPLRPPYAVSPAGAAEYAELFSAAEALGASVGCVRWGRDRWGGAGLFATRAVRYTPNNRPESHHLRFPSELRSPPPLISFTLAKSCCCKVLGLNIVPLKISALE